VEGFAIPDMALVTSRGRERPCDARDVPVTSGQQVAHRLASTRNVVDDDAVGLLPGSVRSASTTGMPKSTNGDRSVRGPDGVRITLQRSPRPRALCKRPLWRGLRRCCRGKVSNPPRRRCPPPPHDVAEERPRAYVRDDQGPNSITTGARLRATRLGRYPRSFTTCNTIAARRGSTCGWLLSTRETVAVEHRRRAPRRRWWSWLRDVTHDARLPIGTLVGHPRFLRLDIDCNRVHDYCKTITAHTDIGPRRLTMVGGP